MSKLGIFVTGLVLSKKIIANEKGPRNVLQISIPDIKETLEVKVTEKLFNEAKPLAPVSLSVIFNKWQNQMYWTQASEA